MKSLRSMLPVLICLLSTLITNNSKASSISLCSSAANTLTCPFQQFILNGRVVRFQLPQTERPPTGYPVAIFYQGSVTPVLFTRDISDSFNTYYELRTIEALLNNGYAVIAPEADLHFVWFTNIPDIDYKTSSDFSYITALLENIRAGKFGPLDSNRKFAVGFSSGGYNASRMAISFPGEFKALAIQSASYATCVGILCNVPELPANHPPTLFLHGILDLIVPVWTMQLYFNALSVQSIPVRAHMDPMLTHGWSPDAPVEVTNWLNRY